MYIINQHGVFTDIPDNRPLQAGARKATEAEIAAWLEQDAANKALLLQQKQDAARKKAQLVVVAAPAPAAEDSKLSVEVVANDGTLDLGGDKAKDKAKDNDKSAE